MLSTKLFVFWLSLTSLVTMCWSLISDDTQVQCISTYQQLKASLRSNRTDNVNRMLDAFYPPNKAPSHIVFVRYCIQDSSLVIQEQELLDPEGIVTTAADNCNNMTGVQHEFQWLTNTIPLLIDSDVFQAVTFNLADLIQENITLILDPFCEDIDDLALLSTLTVWLKSYAQGDEDIIKSYSIQLSDEEDIDGGYLGIFEVNGTKLIFYESRLVVNGMKFVVGLWLGTTSITFALILHIGRVSFKTASGLNKVLWEVTNITDKVIALPQKFVSFMRLGQTSNRDKKNAMTTQQDTGIMDMENEYTSNKKKPSHVDQQWKGGDKGDIEMGAMEKHMHVTKTDVNSELEMNTISTTSDVKGDIEMDTSLSDPYKYSTQADVKGDQKVSNIKRRSTAMATEMSESLKNAELPATMSANSLTTTESISPEKKDNKTDLDNQNASVCVNDNLLDSDGNKKCVVINMQENTAVETESLHSEGTARRESAVLRKRLKHKHAFNHFTKSIQKISTISALLVAAFLIYNIYIYARDARRLSYDWLILFPFPFWFIVVVLINFFTFLITESILFCMNKEDRSHSKRTILYLVMRDFYVSMSTTTLPLFIFFHSFWLVLALMAFYKRLLSSFTFYLPLVIFGLWFLAVISRMLNQWKKLLFMTTLKYTQENRAKTYCRFLGLFLHPLLPILFLPFWILFLATLYFFSDFLLAVVHLEEQSFLIILGAIILISITTRKIAKNCLPNLNFDE